MLRIEHDADAGGDIDQVLIDMARQVDGLPHLIDEICLNPSF